MFHLPYVDRSFDVVIVSNALHIVPKPEKALTEMELLHARLVRTTTCADDGKCDYTICGDKDEYLKEHPEYVDEQGFKRNK